MKEFEIKMKNGYGYVYAEGYSLQSDGIAIFTRAGKVVATFYDVVSVKEII